MSDYIERLEGLAARLERTAIWVVSKPLRDQLLIEAACLRSLLSDVERMRGALEEIATLPAHLTRFTDYDEGVMDGRGDAADIARQALSAPNTEEGE